MPNGEKKRVVIIGAGAAGIFTGYLLQRNAYDAFDIKILEGGERVGGHARSRMEMHNGQEVSIDSGAQFFSAGSQPQYYLMLLDEGFIADGYVTEDPAGVSVWNIDKNDIEFWVPSDFWKLVGTVLSNPIDWANFLAFIDAAGQLHKGDDWEPTFGQWLDDIRFPILDIPLSDRFKNKIARPLMYQFGLVAPDRLDTLSAKFVVYYFVVSMAFELGSKSLFNVNNSTIGLDGFHKELLKRYGLEQRVTLEREVKSVTSNGDGTYTITAIDSETLVEVEPIVADEVVYAINPPHILETLASSGNQFDPLRDVLSEMDYVDVPVRIQRQEAPTHMPSDDDRWEVSNVLVKEENDQPTHYMLSVWFGPVREKAAADDFFKSWGSPHLKPQNAPQYDAYLHQLMVGDPKFISHRKKLREEHQGVHNLWFSGGYIIDYDSQNASLKSAANVASAIIHKHQLAPDDAADSFMLYPETESATAASMAVDALQTATGVLEAANWVATCRGSLESIESIEAANDAVHTAANAVHVAQMEVTEKRESAQQAANLFKELAAERAEAGAASPPNFQEGSRPLPGRPPVLDRLAETLDLAASRFEAFGDLRATLMGDPDRSD